MPAALRRTDCKSSVPACPPRRQLYAGIAALIGLPTGEAGSSAAAPEDLLADRALLRQAHVPQILQNLHCTPQRWRLGPFALATECLPRRCLPLPEQRRCLLTSQGLLLTSHHLTERTPLILPHTQETAQGLTQTRQRLWAEP